MRSRAVLLITIVAAAVSLAVPAATARTTSSVEVTNLKSDFSKAGQVTLTWQQTSTTNVLYELVEQQQGTGAWVKLPLLSADARSDTLKLGAGDYHFRVWAVVKVGNKETSGTVKAVEKEEPPEEPPPKEEPPPACKEQTAWAAVGATILTNKEAAARVCHKPEIRSYQVAENEYEPTEAEVLAGRNEKDQYGQNMLEQNPYMAYVDGKDGLTKPSTDDLIQWACDKWGIPVESCRAVMVQESWWRQRTLGDLASESKACVEKQPAYARKSSTEVYESLGISQVKWRCTEPSSGVFQYTIGTGTNPMRWKSTSYSLDKFAATIRFYRDDPGGKRSAWGDSSYKAGETWGALGEWMSPWPANNSTALGWIKTVEKYQAEKFWTKSEFING